jgi:hypothetical protein
LLSSNSSSRSKWKEKVRRDGKKEDGRTKKEPCLLAAGSFRTHTLFLPAAEAASLKAAAAAAATAIYQSQKAASGVEGEKKSED